MLSEIEKLENGRQLLVAHRRSIMPWLLLIPLFVFVFTGLVFKSLPIVFTLGILTIVNSFLIYHGRVASPFKKIKGRFKSTILGEFMFHYHPDINYKYQMNGKSAKALIKSSGLISADKYEEEDVIDGSYKNTRFYISEVNLKNESKNNSYSIFKGILFRIKLPGKSLPKAQIQSQPGFLKRLWNSFKKNEDFGFYFDTADAQRFDKELAPLFPFIKHLIDRQSDLRIRIDGDEIIMLMKSDMAFLDDPPPNLDQPLMREEYSESLAQQVNSLLYIVEAFGNELSPSEIEDRLELKAKEMIKRPITVRKE